MSDPVVMLNPALLRERRLAARLSQRRLADALGVRSPLIFRLERGQSQASLPLQRAQALANILGTSLQQLLDRPATDSDAPQDPEPAADAEADARVLAAILAELDQMVGRDELAEALDWPMRRLHAASRHLRRQLRGTGLHLQSTWGLRLRGEAEHATVERLTQLESARTARRGLNLSTAGVLRQVVAGAVDANWQRRTSNAERVAIAALLRMGLVQDDGGDLTLTAEAAFSLALDD